MDSAIKDIAHDSEAQTTITEVAALEPKPPLPPPSRTRRFLSDPDKRLNVTMTGVLLALAFVFMLPGLPPLRVAAPMQYLLPFTPWHVYYLDVTSPFLGGDLLLQQLPWRHWAQSEFAAGRFPLWASSPFGGMPLFASAQPAVLHPLHLLWILMPIGAGLGIIMALKLWLAGLGMWTFTRTLKLHPVACIIAALSFMFSASMVNWLTWQHSLLILLLPWLAWAVHAWYANGSRPALVALAALVASGLLAGHPENLFLVGVTTGIWTAGLLLGDRSAWRQRFVRMGGALLAVGLGFLTGMVQLLPFLEVLPLTHQAAIRSIHSEAEARYAPGANFLWNWIVPRSQGYEPNRVLGNSFNFTEANGYVGIVALFGLAFVLVASVQRSLPYRPVLPWVVAGIFAYLTTYEGETGTFIRSLPLFNQSINARWVIIVGFCLVVIGAFGWDWLARQVEKAASKLGGEIGTGKRRMLLGGLLLLSAGGVVTMSAHAFRFFPYPRLATDGPWLRANEEYLRYWAIWSGGLALTIAALVGIWVSLASVKRVRQVTPLLISLVLLADLWSLLAPINPTSPAEWYYPTTEIQTQIRDLVPPTERILVVGDVMPANTGLVYNIRDWRAGDPMITERVHQTLLALYPAIIGSVGDEYNVFLRSVSREVGPLLGMQYFVFPSHIDPNGQEADAPPYTRLASRDGLGLWRVEGVPGFAYLSDNVQVVPGEKEALAWIHDSSWQKTRSYQAVVEGTPESVAAVEYDPAGSSPGRTIVEQYAPGRVRIRTEAVRPALLVVAESWYPGWRATLDGKPVDLLRANYLSQGVVVPEGTHTVELEYSSQAFRYGALLSLAGLIGLAGMGFWARPRRGNALPARV